MSELHKSNFELGEYLTISSTVKITYGSDALTYTDYNDLIYVYYSKTYIDFHDDGSVINNDKVIYIGNTFDTVIERLNKILRMKKIKRLI